MIYGLIFSAKLKKPLLFSLAILLSVSLSAQNTPKLILAEKLTNDIFSATYTAGTTPEGAIQLDAELVYVSEKTGRDPYTIKYRWGSFPAFNFRFGLSENFELRAGSRIGYTYQNIPDFTFDNADPLLQEKKDQVHLFHTDYLTVGMKAGLFSFDNEKGRVAILGEAYLPLLRPAEAFGRSFIPTVTLLNEHSLNPKLRYVFNLGTYFNFQHDPFIRETIKASLFPILNLSQPVSLFAGIESYFTRDQSPFLSYNLGGLLSISPGLQVKGNVGTERGINSYNRSWQGTLGVSWRIKGS